MKRVALVGGTPQAVQRLPELVNGVGVERALAIKLFQPTPLWILPRRARWALAQPWVPLTVLQWLARRHLWRQVRDPWLRRQLCPQTALLREAAVLSDDFYPALLDPRCELVTWPIDRWLTDGVRCCDGLVRGFDVRVG